MAAGYLARLASPKAHTAFAVTHHCQRSKTEQTATFDHLCNAVDVDEFLQEIVFAALRLEVCHLSGSEYCKS